MCAMVPNLQELQVVEGMSHWILKEDPGSVNAQLERFLSHPATLAAIGQGDFAAGAKLQYCKK